ncbi:MAG: hypothetical protein WC919_00065 [Candidatus Paceibacterota bacterium]|jgi:hypothetical protein
MALIPGKPWKDYRHKHEDRHPTIVDYCGRTLLDCTKQGIVLNIKSRDGKEVAVEVNEKTLNSLRSVICQFYGWSRWHDHAVEKITRAEAEKQVRAEMDDEIRRRTRELQELIENGVQAKLTGKSVKPPRPVNHKAGGQRELLLK